MAGPKLWFLDHIADRGPMGTRCDDVWRLMANNSQNSRRIYLVYNPKTVLD